MPDPEAHPVVYAVAPAVRVRLLGVALVGVGLVVGVLALLVGYAGVPGVVLTAGVVLAALAVLVVGVLVGPRAWVLRLDGRGYRVRRIRGAGAPAALWAEVSGLVTARLAGSRVVVLELRDGRATRIPVDLLGADPEDLVRTLRERLPAPDSPRG